MAFDDCVNVHMRPGNGRATPFRAPFTQASLRASFVPTMRPGSVNNYVAQAGASSIPSVSMALYTPSGTAGGSSQVKMLKIYWTDAQELALLDSMQIFMAMGARDKTMKLTNVVSKLEKMIAKKYPSFAGIITHKQIRSKLKNWRTKYYGVHDILMLSGSSFLGGTHTLDVPESEAWDDCCKVKVLV